MSQRENIVRLKVVYEALGELSKDVIFVGGATVSLYADRPFDETRPTDDVDILVELLDYQGYAAIEEQLRARGFVNDVDSGVICRYIVQGVVVDVMPTSERILGFSNKWYPEAASNAIQVPLDEKIVINIFQAVYFIATKLEAFKGRGENDGRFSTDFEDIVYVLNNRNTIWEEFAEAPINLFVYLQNEFKKILEEPYIDEWISVHLDYQEQRRVNFIIESLREFVEKGRK